MRSKECTSGIAIASVCSSVITCGGARAVRVTIYIGRCGCATERVRAVRCYPCRTIMYGERGMRASVKFEEQEACSEDDVM